MINELLKELLESSEEQDKAKELHERYGVDDDFRRNYAEASRVSEASRANRVLFDDLRTDLREIMSNRISNLCAVVDCAPASLQLFHLKILHSTFKHLTDQVMERIQKLETEEAKNTVSKQGTV